jgi:hypothetical protein
MRLRSMRSGVGIQYGIEARHLPQMPLALLGHRPHKETESVIQSNGQIEDVKEAIEAAIKWKRENGHSVR